MKTVLLAEDEKMIRRGLAAMVRRAPVPVETVLEARDGLQALELLRARPVDLLITDIRMPGMDGLALMQQVRAMAQPPYVIVISGYDDFSYAVSMLRSGVHDYLLKPVEREKFYAAMQQIEALLQKREEQNQSARERFLLSLRLLMLSGGAPQSNCGSSLSACAGQFFPGPFVARCAAASRRPFAAADGALVLDGADGLQVELAAAGAPGSAAAGVPVGQSAPHRGVAELPQAYAEAAQAWKRAFFAGGTAVYAGAPQPSAPRATADQLTRLVGAARWQEAVRLLAAEAARAAAGELAPDALAALCADFAAQLADAYGNLLRDPATAGSCPRLFDSADAAGYLAALENWLESFCLQIQQELADYENKQRIRQAVQYIRENFRAPLNMAVVSNQVSMNYSLFSLLFKQYTGVNFVSYLQNLRLAEARRLLAETDWRVNEIGARSGFADEKHFSRCSRRRPASRRPSGAAPRPTSTASPTPRRRRSGEPVCDKSAKQHRKRNGSVP